MPLLWGKLTVREHFDLFASAYEIDFDQLAQTTERMLAELQFRRYLDYRVEELSGGTRQKLNLALSLMHDPDLLLLDEPYSGFDWETYLRFWEISAKLRAGGMAILIVSRLISERERFERVAVEDQDLHVGVLAGVGVEARIGVSRRIDADARRGLELAIADSARTRRAVQQVPRRRAPSLR